MRRNWFCFRNPPHHMYTLSWFVSCKHSFLSPCDSCSFERMIRIKQRCPVTTVLLAMINDDLEKPCDTKSAGVQHQRFHWAVQKCAAPYWLFIFSIQVSYFCHPIILAVVGFQRNTSLLYTMLYNFWTKLACHCCTIPLSNATVLIMAAQYGTFEMPLLLTKWWPISQAS